MSAIFETSFTMSSLIMRGTPPKALSIIKRGTYGVNNRSVALREPSVPRLMAGVCGAARLET
jgi:hypothetical protein